MVFKKSVKVVVELCKIYEDNHPHRVKTWRDLNRERYNESNGQRYHRKKQQVQN